MARGAPIALPSGLIRREETMNRILTDATLVVANEDVEEVRT